jgi:citrate lyase subunit beta/citryl-CoA lyase
MNGTVKLLRSWMFVPGHRQRMIDKALALPVDAIMLDVEDGVAESEKETARKTIAASLDQAAQQPSGGLTPARYVRVNAVGHERMHADLDAVVRLGLEGLVVPKVETPEQIKIVERILDEREAATGMSQGSVRVLVAIESPLGLLHAYSIACSSPRITGLMFGAEDYGKEMGLPFQREHEARDLLYARSAIAVAAAAARVQAVDGVWPDFRDIDGLSAFAQQARRLGFTGMSLIHPGQIDAINAAFSPTLEEVNYCRQVVKAFEEATARGDGSIAFGGQLIDPPIVERAQRTLALNESLAVRPAPSTGSQA